MEESQKKATDKKGGTDKKKSIAPRIITIAAIVVTAVGVFTAACAASLPKDKIVSGVSADGIDISGKTLGEAIDAISASDTFKTGTFTISSNGQSRQINAFDIDLAVDVNATAQKAFDVCKTNNKIADAFKSIKLKFSPEEIMPIPSVNTEKLDAILYEFGMEINGEMSEHTVEIGETTAIISPGHEGQSKDVSKTREAVIEALSEGKTNISADFEKQKPADFDEQSLVEAVQQIPQNAEYILESGEASVKPHVVGTDADPAHAKEAAQKVNNGESAEIAITHTMPEITTDALRAKLYAGNLATYSTKYSTSAVNRSKNVELATRRINGTVLLPGDVFSYNGVVGARTVANGFYNAPVYENGKSVDGIGGGVCQVSTTLYSAVLYADLEVVQRQNHSLTVGYVPLGQDATVVDGAIDFQFKNNTDAPVRIDASASGGTVRIALVGTPKAGKSVKITHQTTATTPPTEKETNDPNFPTGTRTVTSAGKTGYTIRSTKIVYQDGKEVSRQSLGNSRYKMVPTEVTVGTGPAAPAAAPAEPATSTQITATPAPVEEAPTAPTNTSEEFVRATPNPVVEEAPETVAE